MALHGRAFPSRRNRWLLAAASGSIIPVLMAQYRQRQNTMRYLKTNTAVIVTVGPFFDKTDGVTIETALTITNERITLIAETDAGSAPTLILDNIAGATSGTDNDLNYITAGDNGMMQIELSAADTNRLGRMTLTITDAVNHVPVFHEFMILPANIYDSLVLGSDLLDTSAVQFAGTAYATALAAEVDAVWDEVLTGATHNVASSSGRRLRTASGGQLDSGTAQAGAVDSITLATSASITAGLYVGCMLAIDGGTGIGQSRYIVGYTAARVAYVARHWVTTPDATSTYVLYADNQVPFIHMGLASAGAASTITLQTTASATNNIYNGQVIRILSGTGDDQIRMIEAYDGTTKVATVDPAWTTQPDNTSYYGTLQTGLAYVTHIDTMAQADVRTALGMASANLDTQLTDIDNFVDGLEATIGAAGAGLTAVPWNAAWDAEVQSEVADALAVYDPPTNAEMLATWTTAMTESYAADGAAPTPAQALFLIQQMLTEMSISGVTMTVKKIDGATTALTLTLNDGTSPTSVTRAT